jgi:hypothetical protein
MRPTRYVASFDSSTAFLRALSRFLHGRDFPSLGALPRTSPTFAGDLVSALPDGMKKWVYAFSGGLEAIQPARLSRVRSERMGKWTVDRYPLRRYPALVIGSASGALIHLCAALGAPWLPQTVLIPVRAGVHPDDPRAALRLGEDVADRLLEPNPDLALHHMHDPAQDRLMLAKMTYFRVKRLRLGDAYTRFIREVLPRGGTIFVADCRRRWPVARVGRRHVFQMGALGGPTAREFFEGSERIAEYLEREGSENRRWDPPPPDEEAPEAEWGFAPDLFDDVLRLASRYDYGVRRIAFDQPEDLSPLVSDLYRWWYENRGIAPHRLLVESFVQLEPWWVLRTGSVPFWMKFNMEDDANALEHYLDAGEPWRFVYLTLFQHGVNGPGLAPVERWRQLLARATEGGQFLGVNPAKHPRDFASFFRYHADLKKLQARYPMPGPLALEVLDDFLSTCGGDYPVRWVEERRAGRAIVRGPRAPSLKPARAT